MKNFSILLCVLLLPLAMQAEKPNRMQFAYTSYVSPYWQDSYVHLNDQMRELTDFVMQFNQIDGDAYSPINTLSVRFNGEDCVVLKNDLVNALAHVQSLVVERSNLSDEEVEQVNQLIDELIDVVTQNDQSADVGRAPSHERSPLCDKDSLKIKKVLCALNKALFCSEVLFNGPVIFNKCVEIKDQLSVEHTAKIHSLKAEKAKIDKIEARKAEIKKIEAKKIDVCELNVTCTANATCDLVVGCNIYMHDSENPLIGNVYKEGVPFIHNFGTDNTFVGKGAGNFTMAGVNNSGFGVDVLHDNITGFDNTAVGLNALKQNTVGFNNSAVGAFAMQSNTSGPNNVAFGVQALQNNTTGNDNAAIGFIALNSNTMGFNNIAIGSGALADNATGNNNIAVGISALRANTTGASNVALGLDALRFVTAGVNNIALGLNAGNALGGIDSSNIVIGNGGVAGDNGAIRIGTIGTHTTNFQAGIRSVATGIANAVPVLIDSNGQLGTMNSSIRFKHNIQDMNEASSPIYNLRPVTFTLIADPTNVKRFGLIAEEVLEVMEDLVIRDGQGQIETVRYMDLITLILNELIKLNDRVIALEEAVYY